MNDSMMPAWMRDKFQQKELNEAKVDAKKQRMLAAKSLFEAKCPEFLRQFKQELAVAVGFLPHLDMLGQICEELGVGVRVSVNRPGFFPNETYTDISFGSNGITLKNPNLGEHTLHFCPISESEVGVCVDGFGAPIKPVEAARFVLEPMTDLIESRS